MIWYVSAVWSLGFLIFLRMAIRSHVRRNSSLDVGDLIGIVFVCAFFWPIIAAAAFVDSYLSKFINYKLWEKKKSPACKKLVWLIPILMLFGCTEKKPVHYNYVVPMKFCLIACRQNEFRNFHHSTSLSGASSMSGLSQTQIYDRVNQECEKIFDGEKCCVASWRHERKHYQPLNPHLGGYGMCP